MDTAPPRAPNVRPPHCQTLPRHAHQTEPPKCSGRRASFASRAAGVSAYRLSDGHISWLPSTTTIGSGDSWAVRI